MLRKITSYADVDPRKLMDVYAESTFDNALFSDPDAEDVNTAVRRAESGFLDYLQKEFLADPDNACWVLEEHGLWVSALRTSRISPGLYYLEALETRPDCRRQGYAARLLGGVVDALKEDGPFRLCDCVERKNKASLRTHEKCGFRIVSEKGYNYLEKATEEKAYGLEYRYDPDQMSGPSKDD